MDTILKPIRSIIIPLLALACGSIFVTGCASQYVVVLTNGQRYTAAKKPAVEKVNGQFAFVFTDLSGQTNAIPSGLVRAVVPASDIKPGR